MSLSPETHIVVDALEAASRGTSALAGDIRANRRSVEGEKRYADFLRELAGILEVSAWMYDEQQNPSARVLDLSEHRPTAPATSSPDFALFGDLLGELGTLVHRFSERFVEAHSRPPEPEPPHDPPPITA
ncbi:hypothetical protein OG439_46280 [Amycolatopsis sp. NBC_01307]|uniref:hypothetical protein n=1 Tax=Amycolatopsis sp. NBC_01307 TaxID=2903561 RepID=UPI002E0EDAC0|nr:hypothetical protein OG439_46280 [Amycolatopsis sp. NBC_01307]